MTQMTTAEYRGYQQICGADGAMMVIAADQRGGMRQIMAATPADQAAISDAMLGETKADLTRYLASQASCILLDPICAVPNVVDDGVLARDTALLDRARRLGFRHHARRLPPVPPRARHRCPAGAGARRHGRQDHGLSPERPPEANPHNIDILRRCIEDFGREDLLLVVEFLTYELPGESKADYKALVPKLIEDGTRLCLELGSKVLKLPYPGTEEACAAVTALCGTVPWAVLSAGVDHETFIGQVEIAMRNGASGVIAGRSLWKDCISLDRTVTRDRLTAVAVPRLRQIQAVIARHRKSQAA